MLIVDAHGSRSHARAARVAGRTAARRGRDARRGGRPRPARREPAATCSRTATRTAIALWPHTKTHKSPEIGLRQLELGAGGLTVAKTGEAAGLPGGGRAAHPRALPAVRRRQVGAARAYRGRGRRADGRRRRRRPGRGPRRGAAIAAALRAALLVELDVGLHRTGQTTAAGALALAQALSRLPAVEVAGISCYPGHCRGDADDRARTRRGRRRAAARDARRLLGRRAYAAIASRAARRRRATSPTRPASTSSAPGPTRCSIATTATLDKCALWVEVTVISDAVPGQIVVDAGSKTLTSDDHPDGGHGAIVGLPDAHLHTLNEEHGYVDVSPLDERPARRRPPAGRSEPRVRLRQPARRRAGRARRRRRSRDPGGRTRARPLAPRTARARRAARRSTRCSRCC